jgi:hypothetical protein
LGNHPRGECIGKIGVIFGVIYKLKQKKPPERSVHLGIEEKIK